jgi:hypothetical protein
VIVLFIYIYLFPFVWVVVAGAPQLRAPEEILLGIAWRISHLFLRERPVEVPKNFKKSRTQTSQCVRLQSCTPLG